MDKNEVISVYVEISITYIMPTSSVFILKYETSPAINTNLLFKPTRIVGCQCMFCVLAKVKKFIWNTLLKGVYIKVIFSVGCNSRIRHRTKIGSILIFCVVLDAAVVSDTENHDSCKQAFFDTAVVPMYLTRDRSIGPRKLSNDYFSTFTCVCTHMGMPTCAHNV
jgi:hypothetical protein